MAPSFRSEKETLVIIPQLIPSFLDGQFPLRLFKAGAIFKRSHMFLCMFLGNANELREKALPLGKKIVRKENDRDANGN